MSALQLNASMVAKLVAATSGQPDWPGFWLVRSAMTVRPRSGRRPALVPCLYLKICPVAWFHHGVNMAVNLAPAVDQCSRRSANKVRS